MKSNDEKKNLLENAGTVLNDDELKMASGGANGSGHYLTVGNCGGSYLALRPEPVWDQYHEIGHLFPGYEVFTYGRTTRGTGLNGISCKYTYVSFKGVWGWAESAFLH